MKESRLSFWQLWNMSFGFLGIQFGWGLQMANMSAIFEYLGANAHEIPILWIAAPITGLIVQPIIGNMSDYTWGPLGRRRPYFLVGAILGSIALILMPHVSALWMAAGLLWILDTSANISMEPLRAFVGDLLPQEQRTHGFAVQSLLIGFGSVAASSFPWILNHGLHLSGVSTGDRPIPVTIEYSFYAGAALFFGTVLWTVVTTDEPPPEDFHLFQQKQEERGGLFNSIQEIWRLAQEIPPTMQQLAWVQMFTWFGLFCFFLYFPPAVAHNIFGATQEGTALYAEGIEWAGICIAAYNAVCVLASFLLPRLEQLTNRQTAHTICLLCGAAGLLSLGMIQNKYLLFLPAIGIGIAWASVLAMPYAMLVGALPPQHRGIYMGMFNFFIVLPQVAVSLGFGWVMQHILGDDRLLATMIGGCFLAIGAFLTQRVDMTSDASSFEETPTREQTVGTEG